MATKTTSSKLIVYRGFLGTNNYVWSPFVNKLEIRLRLTGLPYRVEPGSMRQAPRSKVPYLGFEGSDELLADTTLIIRKFVEDGTFSDLNAGLTPVQKAQDLAIRSLLEDKLYFYLVRERWIDNFYTMRPGALAAMPYFLQLIIGNLAYNGTLRTLYGQGTGRYTKDEVRQFKLEIWENLNVLLSESRNSSSAAKRDRHTPFWVLGRPEPSEADATVYAFIVASLVCTAAPETQKTVRTFPVLVDYAKRVHNTYYSDYDIWEDQV
ncbi:hypothetical protein GE09DRAFT_1105935 [Coniochaeta sp. 2T2.1]|nr:hypothetical protein GE09DRAFT_1105935 [Coniochaeta sp. 2T2.1]